MSMRGTESHDLVLDEVEVSEENFVEHVGQKVNSLNHGSYIFPLVI